MRDGGLRQLVAGQEPPKLVALANKMARTAWALLTKEEFYRRPRRLKGFPGSDGACG